MARIGNINVDEVRQALAGKRGPEARLVIRDLAAKLGVTPAHIYRVSRELRAGERKRRTDAGARRIAIRPDVEDFMFSLTLQADLAAQHVLLVTARHFGLPANFLSESTYNSWLRRARLSRRDNRRDIRPYRAFEAPYANYLHHYDTTISKAFYANNDGSVGFEPEYARYKNKPGNRKPRIVLYSLVDDYSRVLFARFYYSENALNLLDFVLRAWSQKDDKRFPFYGIPEHLYADLGSPHRSAKFQHALTTLGVSLVDTTPSHATEFGSRKHGKVERTFGNGLLDEYMKLTKVTKFTTLDEMNGVLFDWLVLLNNKKNRTTGEVRFARWLRSVGTPRSMPNAELFALLHYDRAVRTVARDLSISLNGKRYQLPYHRPCLNWVDLKVEVYWYPGADDKITVVYDHHEEELSALAPVVDLALEYKRLPQTERDERRAALNPEALRTIDPTSLYNSNLPYLPKRGEEFDESKITDSAKLVETEDGAWRPSFVPARYLNRVEVKRELAAARLVSEGQLSPTDLALLNQCMAERDTISEDDLAAFIRDYREKSRNVA